MQTGKEMFFVGNQFGSPMQPCVVRIVEEADEDGTVRVTPVNEEDLDTLEMLGGNSLQYVPSSSLEELDEDGVLTLEQVEAIANHKLPLGEGDGINIPIEELVSGEKVIITKMSISDLMQGAIANERATVVAGLGQTFVEHPAVRPEAVGKLNESEYAIAITERGVMVLLEDDNNPQKEKE